jgi:predicted metalloprotease with PDZ domain
LLSTQRETFGDDNYPYFLVNFLSEDSDCSDNVKFAGTAHPNSFRAVFPGGPKCIFKPEMRQLISHGLMHMWIGKIIRIKSEERGHIDGKWFTEGFTEFFSRLLAYHADVLTKAEFFSSLNRQLEKYFTSSERFVTLGSLVERMYRRGFSTRELEDIPYQQGEIMAWRLNSSIKLATTFNKSLTNVIKDMLVDAQNAGGEKKLTMREIATYFDRYAPAVFAEEYAKIVNGKLLIPPDLLTCSNVEKGYITKFLPVPIRSSSEIYTYQMPQAACDRWLK